MASHSLTLVQIKIRPPTLIAPPFSKGPVRAFGGDGLSSDVPSIGAPQMIVNHSLSAATELAVDVELGASRVRETFHNLLAHARTLPEVGVEVKQKKDEDT